MTREDIDRIRQEYFDTKESEFEMDEIFELAKKSLENSYYGDAISRKAVIGIFGVEKYLSSSEYAMLQAIKEIPSVIVKSVDMDAFHAVSYREGYKKAKEDIKQEFCSDAISRELILKQIEESVAKYSGYYTTDMLTMWGLFSQMIKELPSVTQKSGEWIPVSERLPENHRAVNITWVNHNPYYADIKDKPFVATAHYHNGKWFWFSVVCEDYLMEYGQCDCDVMGEDIEVIAWMPLPESYKPQESEDKE